MAIQAVLSLYGTHPVERPVTVLSSIPVTVFRIRCPFTRALHFRTPSFVWTLLVVISPSFADQTSDAVRLRQLPSVKSFATSRKSWVTLHLTLNKNSAQSSSALEKSYELPDGQVITIGHYTVGFLSLEINVVNLITTVYIYIDSDLQRRSPSRLSSV